MKRNEKIALVVGAGVIILWIINWVGVKYHYGCDNTGSGTFGDMFGAANALFSGLTIVGLIYTIFQQRDEITLARNQHDAQLTQAQTHFDEQKGQIQDNFDKEKDYLRRQLKLQNYERFENTFFSLLDIHADVVDRLETVNFMNYHKMHITSLPDSSDKAVVQRVYLESTKDYNEEKYGQYVTVFESVINHVVTRKKKQASRLTYISIYVAQMTFYELEFLLYYASLYKKPMHWNDVKAMLFLNLTLKQIPKNHHNFLDAS